MFVCLHCEMLTVQPKKEKENSSTLRSIVVPQQRQEVIKHPSAAVFYRSVRSLKAGPLNFRCDLKPQNSHEEKWQLSQ